MISCNGLKNALSSRFSKNTVWILSERIIQMVISLLVGMLTARYLGPSNYGVINYVAAYISFATPICNLGLDGLLVKYYIDRPRDTGVIAGTSIVFEFFSACLSMVLICTVVYFTNYGDSLKTIIAFLESIRLLFKSTEAIEYWFQSQLRSKITSIIRVFGYLVMSIYRIILLIAGCSVEWFAFATSLDMIVIAVCYFLVYHRYCNYKLQFSFSYGLKLLHESYHFILSGIMVVLYSQMDKVMIQSMLGEYDVGLYSAAYTICNLWFFIPAALITSAQPLIMRKKDLSESDYLISLEKLYCAIFWLGVLIGLIISIFSRYVIIILYGNDYIGATSSLIIGIWYGVFAQLGNARGIWILCEHKNEYIKKYLLWGTICNLILNALLIRLWGINGASLATLITQFLVCFVVPLCYKETRMHSAILIDAVLFKWRNIV